MASPKHTYTYSRLGVGDVAVLAPEGHPYTLAASGAGWTARYHYASDRLASVRDLAKWTEFIPGTIPASANKVAVDVLSSPTLTPSEPGLKVTISTNNYKAASGHQYTDSGSSRSLFNQVPVFPAGALFHFDFTDIDTLWQDTGGTSPITADGQTIARVDNTGSDPLTHIQQTVGANEPLYKVDIMGTGLAAARFDGINDTLFGTVVAARPGDIQYVVIYHAKAAPTGTDYVFNWDSIEFALFNQTILATWRGNIGTFNVMNTAVEPAIDTNIATYTFDTGANVNGGEFSWDPVVDVSGQVSAGPDASSPIAIGAADGSSNWAQVDVAEVAVWPWIGGPSRTSILQWIAGKYGVTWLGSGISP